MNPELQQLKDRLAILEQQMVEFRRPDRFQFNRAVRFGAKLGFFNKEPMAQQTAITSPSGGGGSDLNAIDITARTAIGQIKTALQNLGLTA